MGARTFEFANTNRVATNWGSGASITMRNLSMWIYYTGSTNFARLFSLGSGFQAYMGTGSNMTIIGPWATTSGTWTVPKPTANQWVHIWIELSTASTSENPFVRFDGVSQTVTETAAPVGSVNAPSFNLTYGNGNSPTWNRGFEGHIGECRFWTRGLALSEVEALAAGYPIHGESLVSAVDMGQGPRDTIAGSPTVTGTTIATTSPRLHRMDRRRREPAQSGLPRAIALQGLYSGSRS